MRQTTKILALTLVAFLSLQWGQSQGDLLGLLGEEKEETIYSTASFKTTRIVNLHSIENVAGGVLDFRINHRFGFVNSGISEFFGLDQATIRLGLDYGITDRLMVGVGRSNFQKTVDGFVKYKLLRQSTGLKEMPLSVSLLSAMAINTTEFSDPDRENFFSNRLFYTHQVLLARKFSNAFSLQLSPSIVHRNLVETRSEKNTVFTVGAGARIKLSNRVTLNAEYVWVEPDALADRFTNSLSIGFDIETGGHVFQLHVTNSTAMNEKGFMTETVGDWGDGDIHFGFNISRVFTLKE